MAITKINIDTFLSLAKLHQVIDVRSEGEYAHAHFPGAVSLPLFTNNERKIVGTAYKQESKHNAIKLGLQLFGPKMVTMIETVERLLENTCVKDGNPSKTIIVYCWRGGMRSGGVAWLLDLYGFKVYTLVGGYKAFRKWGLQQLEKDYPLLVAGGYTGSGKTRLLHELKKLGQKTIDLENLAKHKGSAFGNIEMQPQPSQEMFENLLAVELFTATEGIADDSKMINDNEEDRVKDPNLSTAAYPPSVDASIPIWVEDESQRIGLVNLPTIFYKRMRSKPVYFLDIPFEERLNYIVAEYGKYNTDDLINAAARIQKRLGGLETKTAINYILQNKLHEGFSILLKYYDKQYLKGLHTRDNLPQLLHKLECETVDAQKNAHAIKNATKNIYA